MLQLLTDYLLQYRTVFIPHVGVVTLVQQPAQTDVVHQQLLPPSLNVQVEADGEASNHQMNYLLAASQETNDGLAAELNAVCLKLQEAINGPGFNWVGIGHFSGDSFSTASDIIQLKPVKAQKLMRETPNHTVLVGDRETTSLQLADEKLVSASTARGSQKMLIIVGWILLVLSILVIAYLFYIGKFSVGASGSKLHVSGLQSVSISQLV